MTRSAYATRGLVEFASGATAHVYSGANPDGLHGPEHDFAWCDELAKWAYPQASWDNLMLGLRAGEGARALITTTPRPLPMLRALLGRADVMVTRGRTADNESLPGDYQAAMEGAAAAEAWGADLVVVETNQGGEMVEAVLRSADVMLPVRPVRARFGKGRRAEPVSILFASGKAKFAGVFPELEDELCGMTGAGYEGPGRSPDRADAMVWAMAELLLGGERGPRIRRL